MANPWFRMYAEFATDPKVQRLSELNQRRLTMIFCLRCNGCVTLHDLDVTFMLRITDAEWVETKSLFIERGFINEHNEVLNWDKRQYISDSSKSRVARHRAKIKDADVTDVTSRNVTVTPPEQIQNRTDTDKSLGDKTAVTSTKGKALPSDWVLPKSWGEWALTEKPTFTKEQIRVIAETFKDHWLANSNQSNSKKADWEATWRNWVRRQTAPPEIKKSNDGLNGMRVI